MAALGSVTLLPEVGAGWLRPAATRAGAALGWDSDNRPPAAKLLLGENSETPDQWRSQVGRD